MDLICRLKFLLQTRPLIIKKCFYGFICVKQLILLLFIPILEMFDSLPAVPKQRCVSHFCGLLIYPAVCSNRSSSSSSWENSTQDTVKWRHKFRRLFAFSTRQVWQKQRYIKIYVKIGCFLPSCHCKSTKSTTIWNSRYQCLYFPTCRRLMRCIIAGPWAL